MLRRAPEMASLKLRELKADVAKALRKSAEGFAAFDELHREYEIVCRDPDIELLRSGDVSGGNKYFAGNPKRDKALGLVRDEIRKLQRIRESVIVWLDSQDLRQERRELTECLDGIHERMAIARETIKEAAEKAHGKRVSGAKPGCSAERRPRVHTRRHTRCAAAARARVARAARAAREWRGCASGAHAFRDAASRTRPARLLLAGGCLL